MAKITCPHCKAVNQDVTESDRCWQCDKLLGAPAPEPSTDAAAGREVYLDPQSGAAEAAGPQLAQRSRPEPKVPIEERYKPVGPNYPVIAISIVALIAVIIAILFALHIIHF
ncbi:MAG TPA: hypothetical protein VKT77_17230 [Chthonomonadaceae bacterium]|nr:hypothetical protein [Chthonomonadaceae bacterium]